MTILPLLQHSPESLIVVCSLLGLIIGSFLNVIIYRVPIMLEKSWQQECQTYLNPSQPQQPPANTFNLFSPRSHCPSCQTPIRAWHNIPVLSYLLLGGKCSHCQHIIPIRYPAVELLTAALSAYIAWQFGFSWEMLASLIFAWGLISLTVIDVDHQLLPDQLTYTLLWLGLLVNLFQLFCTPQAAILGATLGYSGLWFFAHAFKWITGKEGMGHGDFKLLAALGAWLGYQSLPLIIIMASVIGSLVGIGLILYKKHSRDTAIPFGPYLAMAGLATLLWGDTLQQTYWQLAGL